MERPEYAIVVDSTYDAVVLRDVLRQAAQDRFDKAAKAVQRHALDRNMDQHRILAKYAERCEHIRADEAERIAESLGVK